MADFYRLASSLFGTIFIAFGVNAIVRPESALSFFELQYPSSLSTHTQLVDALSAVYGVRDIFMGLAIYAMAYLGNRKSLGCIVILSAAVGIADGVVCKIFVGTGEWNHWAYAPVLGLLGAMMMRS